MDESELYNEPESWSQHKGAPNLTLGVSSAVVDGNTIEAEFAADGTYRVRLLGVDAPSLSEPSGREARDFLTTLHEADGKTRGLCLDRSEFDEHAKTGSGEVYFNHQAQKYTGDKWRSANYQIVRRGLARASSRYGEFEGMYHAEDAARAEGVGVWSGHGSEEGGRQGSERSGDNRGDDGVTEVNPCNVPETLPMTALILLIGFIAVMYETEAWRMWVVVRYAVADTLLLGDTVALGVVWLLMGLAASTVIPGIYLAIYTTASKYEVDLPDALVSASPAIYSLGVAGAVAAMVLGVFFTALCMVDPFSDRLSEDFLPALQGYMRTMANGALRAYGSDFPYVFDISKPWVLYFAGASYCAVVGALSLMAVSAGRERLKGIPWRAGWSISWTFGAPLRIIHLMVFRRMKAVLIFAVAWAAFWAACTAGVNWALFE